MSRATSISDAARDAFYAAATAGLRALDAREPSPRRVGPEADLRWSTFRGALTDADRLDLLLRDAAHWGAAFSPSDAFDLFGLAPDEPFGPDWPLLTPSAARALLARPPATTPADYATRLGLSLTPQTAPTVSPSTRVVVAGPSAFVALADLFIRAPDLRWSSQVLAIATAPAHRQLASLMAIATQSAAPTTLLRPLPSTDPDLTATLRRAGFSTLDLAFVSPDAEPDCALFARTLAP